MFKRPYKSHLINYLKKKLISTKCIEFPSITRHQNQLISPKKQTQFSTVNIYNTKHIIGRESELNQIHNYFLEDNLLALIGKSGIGKTSVAIKYAQEYVSSYKYIWRINSKSTGTLLLDFALLANEIGLISINPEDIIMELSAKLKPPNDFMLFIFDDAVMF